MLNFGIGNESTLVEILPQWHVDLDCELKKGNVFVRKVKGASQLWLETSDECARFAVQLNSESLTNKIIIDPLENGPRWV